MSSFKKAMLGALLFTAPFFAGAAQAQYVIDSTNAATTTGSTLQSTNNATVTGAGTFSTSATITNGAGNHIGSSAVGASSTASIDVSIPAANIANTPGAASTVHASSITGTNAAGATVTGGGTFTAPIVSAGMGNSITSQAIGAAAGSSITFRAQ